MATINPLPGGGSYPAGGVPYNYIQSGLAFFVLGDVATGTVTLTENSKASSSSENIMPSWSETGKKSGGQLRTNMYASDDNKIFTLVDGTLNLFADKYNDVVDINDAKKIPGFSPAENISIKTNSQLLAVERRHAVDVEDTVLLNMKKMEVRYYRFEFIAQDFDPSITAFLEDSYNNTRIPLNINGTSVYDFNVVNIADSWNPARFRIVFKPGVSTELPITHNAVMMGQSRSQIMVYPNPVTDGNINLQLINQPKGKYGIRLINKVGQVITTKQIEHAEGSSTETFRMNKTLAHETYQLEVIKPDNSRVNIKVLY